MNLMSKLVLTISLTSIVSLADTTYQVDYQEMPRYTEVVNQLEYVNMPSYDGVNKWWLCGHAAFSTAINVLRTTDAKDVDQLEWFHKQLTGYEEYKNDIHKQAKGDFLAQIMNNRDDYIAIKESQMDRSKIKTKLQNELKNDKRQQLVVLTQYKGWGHFVVLYKIHTKENDEQGGIVQYADPYGGHSSKTMGYKDFLNGMKNAGTKDRYSFWIIREK